MEENLSSVTSGIRQGCSLSSYFCNTVFEVVARTIREKEEMERIQIGRELKLLLILIILYYTGDAVNSSRKSLEIINILEKQDTKLP